MENLWRSPETSSVNRLPMLNIEHPTYVSLDGIWNFQLLTNPNWLLMLLIGLVLAVPIHTMGYSIGYHKLFAHASFKAKRWYPYVSTFIEFLPFGKYSGLSLYSAFEPGLR